MTEINQLLAKLQMETATIAKDTMKNTINDISQFYMENLGTTEDEVAIFLIDKDKTMLSFACPKYLVNSGMIPVSSTDAIVANIFRTGNPAIVNSFSQQKHLSVFEIIKTPDGKIKPIWKMIGCLISVDNDKIGVIEVSRRGVNFSEAGEDFTHDNLNFLRTTIDQLAPFIKKVVPKDYKGKIS